MKFIVLTGAVFAVVVFFNEIGNILTAPDVRVDVESVWLRCGSAINARAIPDKSGAKIPLARVAWHSIVFGFCFAAVRLTQR